MDAHRGRREWWRSLLGPAAAAALVLGATVSCGDAARSEPSRWDDRWQVWVCRVPPVPNRHHSYGPGSAAVDTVHLAEVLEAELSPWFEAVSYGRYRPTFRAGGEVILGPGAGPEQCLEQVLDRSAMTAGPPADAGVTEAVLAVADAPHRSDQRGGFARRGRACGVAPCAASVTRRGAYVGGADFMTAEPRWDLVQHEMGHTLGWRHSAVASDGTYASAIDVMSDSAWVTRAVPSRRLGPAPLAIHRAESGWLPDVDIARVGRADVERSAPHALRLDLRPLAHDNGTRLLRLELDATRWLAVEIVADEDLPVPLGATVHLVDEAGRIPHQALVGPPPHVDLLRRGDDWEGFGWSVRVADVSADGIWRIEVVR